MNGETDHLRVAIVGSGFGGLGTAIRLKQEGIEDFLVFEKADDLGGTWRDNSYPGCACDVPSHLYSFSFALNPDWSRSFSGQAEIWSYLRKCVERFGIGRHLRFGHEVRSAEWDEAAQRWRLETARGVFTADVGGRRRRPVERTDHARRCPASTRSPARSSTRPAGATTTTCRDARSP